MSSPLPLNPLEIYCHALSRRPPCCRAEESLYEERSFTASSTGRGGSSARAVVVAALVTGRRTGLRPSLPNFPRSRVPQKMRLVGVEGYGRCRHCSCYGQEDRAASLSDFPRSRVPQKMRLVVVEEKEDPSIPGSTGKATLSRRGREQSSSRCLLSRGEKSMAAPTRVVCRANVDWTSQPPGTAAGCGSSLAWWNRLTTTLSGAPGLLS